MKKKTAFAGFIIPVVTFSLAAIIDVVTNESDPGALLAFLVEVPTLIALPVLNYKQEKALLGRLTAKQYNACYLTGYFLAAAAVLIFISRVDVGDFFEHDETVWLDLRGLFFIFLGFAVAGGFVWALIFRGIAALIKLCKNK